MCACFDILYLKEFFIDQDIDGKDVPLKKFKNKVLLIVNVASQW
jgi:glutathione peroxidase-family protein